MKICLKENEFNPSLLSQSWCDEEKAKSMGYTIVEIDEQYKDCSYEDFDNFIFNIKKYNARKQKEIDVVKIAEIQARLDNLDKDFRQADLGAVFDDLEERKAEFIKLHNELRVLEGKQPREYEV